MDELSIYCGECEGVLVINDATDDCDGNIREYAECPCGKTRIYFITGKVED